MALTRVLLILTGLFSSSCSATGVRTVFVNGGGGHDDRLARVVLQRGRRIGDVEQPDLQVVTDLYADLGAVPQQVHKDPNLNKTYNL